jgi:hypothetical protein
VDANDGTNSLSNTLTEVFFQRVVVDVALNVGVEVANDVVTMVEILTVYAVLVIVLLTIVPRGAENCAMYVPKLQSRYTDTMSKYMNP